MSDLILAIAISSIILVISWCGLDFADTSKAHRLIRAIIGIFSCIAFIFSLLCTFLNLIELINMV